MPGWMIHGERTLWWIGLAAIIVGAIPVSLFSQENLISQQARSATDQPFAGYDASLTSAADTVLASATGNRGAVFGSTDVDQPSNVKRADRIGWWSRLQSDAFGPAAARVDLLRPAIEPILRSQGVPTDLVAVILVESGGRADALSPKGARGLWQLMPNTARRYGLHVDEIRDDRLDLFRSTEAAARYLHDLYAQFGDWKLALAAYNTGEANVLSAIQRAHTDNFDQLAGRWMLPLETRNYVPRVLAAAPTLGQPAAFATGQRRSGATTVFAIGDR